VRTGIGAIGSRARPRRMTMIS